MSEQNSIPEPARNKPAKPAKPYPEFPLTAHPAGYWCKKIRGKVYYFGPRFDFADPAAAAAAAEAALAKYLEQKDALHAGRKPREATEGTTVKELCNGFLNHKQELVDGGELSPRTWADYKQACVLVIGSIGKQRLVADLDADDFAGLRNKMAKKWGPHRVGKVIQCVRCLFKYALDAGLIDRPVRFGPGFQRPSKKVLRLHKARQGTRLFSADEVRKLLGTAGPQLKAMILLGINCGFGNSDCGNLPLATLDLERGWLDYPRPKTGLDRRCPLWPETVKAIREALAGRPAPKDPAHAGLVFLTKYGLPWARDNDPGTVTKEMTKLLRSLDINGHRNYYSLRHTFRTVADGSRDQPACDFVMGHEVPHMSSVYRETISDARLRAVVDHVRCWLFPDPEKAQDRGGEEQ
jgi:integrase